MRDIVAELKNLVCRPEIHRQVVGDYQGPYTLGVARCEGGPDGWGLVLRIQGSPKGDPPAVVRVDDLVVPVLVQTGWKQPVPQG